MGDEALLEEYSRMINELVDARRELARLNARLQEKERFLSRVLELSPSAIHVLNLPNLETEYSNRDFLAGMGYGPADLPSPVRLPESVMLDEDRDSYRKHIDDLRGTPGDEMLETEFRVRDKSGDMRWLQVRRTVFARDEKGRASKAVGIIEDITARKAKETNLLNASLEDPLTGLLNRRGFLSAAVSAMGISARTNAPCTLVFFDLDDFKSINDSFGHSIGDEALKTAANAISATFRASDLKARYGGDEFVVLMRGADSKAAEASLARLRKSVDRENESPKRGWKLGFSVGYAVHDPQSSESIADLVGRADALMYADKATKQ